MKLATQLSEAISLKVIHELSLPSISTNKSILELIISVRLCIRAFVTFFKL